MAATAIQAAAQQAVKARTMHQDSHADSLHTSLLANNSHPSARAGTSKTPSWTSIVEAYHREGDGDREMLLALLNAKAKEDERCVLLSTTTCLTLDADCSLSRRIFPSLPPLMQSPKLGVIDLCYSWHCASLLTLRVSWDTTNNHDNNPHDHTLQSQTRRIGHSSCRTITSLFPASRHSWTNVLPFPTLTPRRSITPCPASKSVLHTFRFYFHFGLGFGIRPDFRSCRSSSI